MLSVVTISIRSEICTVC